jgi:hypothetical protein
MNDRRILSGVRRMARRFLILTVIAAMAALMGASSVLAAPAGRTSATAITLTTNATPTDFRATGGYKDTITSSSSCFVPDGHVVWFTWVATGTTTFSASTFGSSYDTIVFVYDGSMVEIGCNDEYDFGVDCGGGNHCSKVVFSATSGETYYIAVAAYDTTRGGKGQIQVSD